MNERGPSPCASAGLALNSNVMLIRIIAKADFFIDYFLCCVCLI
jgi:hypothetical protein